MRLIDADAFKEYIRESFEDAKGEFQTEKYLKIADSVTEGFLKDIDEQPTVEAKPVVYGDWVHGYNCSECGFSYMDYADADSYPASGNPLPNFCGNCGADMRKKVPR